MSFEPPSESRGLLRGPRTPRVDTVTRAVKKAVRRRSGGVRADLVIVANRLPVDRVVHADGSSTWRRSPGGLVSALAPVMTANEGAWIGWPGDVVEDLDVFEHDGVTLVPVAISQQEYEEYYEGFSNPPLGPLYHALVAKGESPRGGWDGYVEATRRFAAAAAEVAAE